MLNMKAQDELKKFWINPFSKIENIFRERKLRKEKKLLQLKLAMFSGGITRMK
jgi:hypothetical protein